MTLYRIHWQAAITGATGHGTGQFTKETAKEIADDMNRTFPYPVLFTAEPVPTAEAPNEPDHGQPGLSLSAASGHGQAAAS